MMTVLPHKPVLLQSMLRFMAPKANEIYLDATFGAGGYSKALLKAAPCEVVAIDKDSTVVPHARTVQARYPDRFYFITGCFGDMASLLSQAGYTQLHGIVLDLGLSSMQIDTPARGFSYMQDGPLDMRMGKQQRSAADILHLASEQDLADIFYRYGEERHARRLARALVQARQTQPLTRTKQLADIIAAQLGGRKHEKRHPAMRCFQALRIAVNDELGELEQALIKAPRLLAEGGRLVIVSFHSLEDRLVKQTLTHLAGRTASPSRHLPATERQPATFALLTRRAIRPTACEIADNPRAASARLRAVQRKKGGQA